MEPGKSSRSETSATNSRFLPLAASPDKLLYYLLFVALLYSIAPTPGEPFCSAMSFTEHSVSALGGVARHAHVNGIAVVEHDVSSLLPCGARSRYGGQEWQGRDGGR
jgi:hypothetical protein